MVLYLASCDRLDGIDEGDNNTYTWKGTLYDRVTDNPLPNASLYLEAEYPGTPESTFEIITEGSTDENGYYSLTYRKIRRPVTGLSLFTENNGASLHIRTGDKNKDYYRDLATIPHVRVNMKIIGLESDKDTLILRPYALVESDSMVNASLNPSENGKYILIIGGKSTINISMKCRVVARAQGTGLVPWGCSYVIGESNFRKAINASPEENFWKGKEYDLEEFPAVNEIDLEIN